MAGRTNAGRGLLRPACCAKLKKDTGVFKKYRYLDTPVAKFRDFPCRTAVRSMFWKKSTFSYGGPTHSLVHSARRTLSRWCAWSFSPALTPVGYSGWMLPGNPEPGPESRWHSVFDQKILQKPVALRKAFVILPPPSNGRRILNDTINRQLFFL